MTRIILVAILVAITGNIGDIKMAKGKKEQAFILFDQGKRPSDPEVKELGVKNETLYRYFTLWKSSNPSSPSDSPSDSPSKIEATGLANAQQLRFVPRVYITDYSPIIRAAQDAAVEFWGWPRDMTLGDFLDTALHFLFREHGITLAGYTISDEAQKALEEEREEQEKRTTKEVSYGG